MRQRRLKRLVPIDISLVCERRLTLFTLQHKHRFRFPAAIHDRLIDHRFVLNHFIDFDTAGSRHDHLRLGIFDAHRELVRCKSAKHHGMNRTQPSTRQHRHGGLWDHRHVDDNAIAFGDALRAEHSCNFSHLITHTLIGVALFGSCHRGVINQRRFGAASLLTMVIEREPAGVHHTVRKPAFNPVVILR